MIAVGDYVKRQDDVPSPGLTGYVVKRYGNLMYSLMDVRLDEEHGGGLSQWYASSAVLVEKSQGFEMDA